MTTTELEELLELPRGTVWNHIRLGNIGKPNKKIGNVLWWSNKQVKDISLYFKERK